MTELVCRGVIAPAHPNVRKIEIMPYHSIGADKWAQLGLSYGLLGLPSASAEQIQTWNAILSELQSIPGR